MTLYSKVNKKGESKELKKLQDDALDASLVVLEGTEVARFALIKK